MSDALRAALMQLNGGAIAIDPRHAPQLTAIVAELASGKQVSDARLATLKRSTPEAASGQSGFSFVPLVAGGGRGVAVVSMHGVALYDLDWQPYCFSTRKLAATLAELADSQQIGAILLDIDTPGGHVTGTQEAADAVWNARKKKPVIGIVNALCASAGYWIGSQCTKLIGVPSADVGSIGVFMCHYDYSDAFAKAGIRPTFIFAGPHKTEGNAVEPLGAEAKAWFQSGVDQTYRDFISAVARGRQSYLPAVEANFGGGRCLPARSALRVGMIDEIALPSQAFKSVMSAKSAGRPATLPKFSGSERLRRLALLEA